MPSTSVRAARARPPPRSGGTGSPTPAVPARSSFVASARTRVALVGFAPYPWAAPLLDPAAAMRLVRKARRRADVVVVLMHAGAEGSGQTHTPRSTEFAFGENRGRPRAFAHAVVRAGADIVLGSGPHVVRGIERYRRRLIAYSLGNFVGYRTLSTGGVLSLSGLLTVRLSPSGVPLGGRWSSVRLDPSGIPHLDRGGASARLVAGLSRQDFGPAAYPMRRERSPRGRALRCPHSSSSGEGTIRMLRRVVLVVAVAVLPTALALPAGAEAAKCNGVPQQGVRAPVPQRLRADQARRATPTGRRVALPPLRDARERRRVEGRPARVEPKRRLQPGPADHRPRAVPEDPGASSGTRGSCR